MRHIFFQRTFRHANFLEYAVGIHTYIYIFDINTWVTSHYVLKKRVNRIHDKKQDKSRNVRLKKVRPANIASVEKHTKTHRNRVHVLGRKVLLIRRRGHKRVAVVCEEIVQLRLAEMAHGTGHRHIVVLNFLPHDGYIIRREAVFLTELVKSGDKLFRNVPVLDRVAEEHSVVANCVGALKVVNATFAVTNRDMADEGQNPCQKGNWRPHNAEWVVLMLPVNTGRKGDDVGGGSHFEL